MENQLRMRSCPACHQEFDKKFLFCPNDQQRLLPFILEDKWQLEEKISEGGFGEVYRGKHIYIKQRCAVKLLHSGLASDPEHIERFRREAEAASKIQHPNVVAVKDFGITKDPVIPYLVMEFIEGITLKKRLEQYVKEKSRLSYSEVAVITKQICDAANAIHAQSIIHRDLKPENLMLIDGDINRIKVIDFGVAKFKGYSEIKTITKKGSAIGTPIYMSPEQCSEKPLDLRSDIYSIGTVVYELLSGQLPFLSETPISVLVEHAVGQPRQLRYYRPDIPLDVEDVVMRAIENRPERRQSSALEFAKELFGALTANKLIDGDLGIQTPQFDRTRVEKIIDKNKQDIQKIKSAEARFVFQSSALENAVSHFEIFIIYAAQDLERVLKIVGHLKDTGLNAWLDRDQNEDAYDSSVVEVVIKNAKAVLLMCSDAAMNSRIFKQELQLAQKYQRPCLPFLLEEISFFNQLKSWLKGWQMINVKNKLSEQWVPQVLKALNEVGITIQELQSITPIQMAHPAALESETVQDYKPVEEPKATTPAPNPEDVISTKILDLEASRRIKEKPIEKEVKRARIFISYRHNSDPDEQVALAVCHSLRQHHEVFIDQTIQLDIVWAGRVEMELRKADYLIAFLSSEAACSEMVIGEIERAHQLAKEQRGRPIIFPIRMAFREQFPYPLNVYLSHYPCTFWDGSQDTPRLIEELMRGVYGGELTVSGSQSKTEPHQRSRPVDILPPLPSAQLEEPEGTMGTQSKFYVARQADAVAIEMITRQGVTITIKAPRQMGKSSLLSRIIDAAVKDDKKRAAFLDFQLIDRLTLADADLFFRRFCCWITDELEMENRVDEYWDSSLGNSQLCTKYVSRYILKELGKPLVLAMDEVDGILGSNFSSDFFAMLRSWHNKRANIPIWKQLDLALVISSEPKLLIENPYQSPFNVGGRYNLEDFTLEQVADLNRRHGSLLNPDEEHQLMALLGGHPYLVRRTLYLIAKRQYSTVELLKNAAADEGPFSDHLRNLLFRLHDREELVRGLVQIINRNECSDEMVCLRLWSGGLVRQRGNKVEPRCLLYADYFGRRLHV